MRIRHVWKAMWLAAFVVSQVRSAALFKWRRGAPIEKYGIEIIRIENGFFATTIAEDNAM